MQAQNMRIYRKVPAAGAEYCDEKALAALASQRYVQSFQYYSTIEIGAAKTGDAPGPYTYPLTQGTEYIAFSYRKGELGTQAGFAAVTARSTETNLVSPAETISGETVEIWGIAVQPKHWSIVDTGQQCDSNILAAISSHVSVDLSVNGGQNRIHMGTLQMSPGAGGLQGSGFDPISTQALDGGRPDMGFSSNGWPTRSNFFRCPEGILWRPKGQADSQLNVIFEVVRDVTIYASGSSENNAVQGVDEAAAAGIRGYTFPDRLSAVLCVHLIGQTRGPRSNVQ